MKSFSSLLTRLAAPRCVPSSQNQMRFFTSSWEPTANLVPMVLESSNRGERAYDIYSRLLRERIIYVHGPITEQLASVVTAQLLFLEAEDPDKKLYMYINSPGGVVTAGMAIYDTMQFIQSDVATICMGQVTFTACYLDSNIFYCMLLVFD